MNKIAAIQSGDLLPHPLADLFPLMDAGAHRALVDDIKAHGLQQSIVLHEGMILDGRNRYRACEEAGVSVRTKTFHGPDPLAYVVSANLQRRHLDESQRAMIAARLANMGEGRPHPNCANLHSYLISRSDAAAMLNVSTRSVASAKAVRDAGVPALVERVESGGLAVSVAAEVAKLPKAAQRKLVGLPQEKLKSALGTMAKQQRRQQRVGELAEATAAAAQRIGTKLYGVVYADPPWRFEPYSRDTGLDRAADNHYPTMTTADISTLPVAAAAADDCVLFLWATAPMLPDALDVMRSWGFTYRSHIIWLKDRIGTGYWARNRHELLLIGTRGDVPAPAPGQQYESVIKARCGEHSQKPIAFAEMIEELFQGVPSLEMFARGPRVGWDVWGNEA
jgi:N6-adenosine-specific RNA methylase IME4